MTAATEHDNLAAALAAFQAEVPSVPKSKTAKVKGHARLQEHVWNLVGKALAAAGYKTA